MDTTPAAISWPKVRSPQRRRKVSVTTLRRKWQTFQKLNAGSALTLSILQESTMMLEQYFRFHAQPFAEHTPNERLWPDERLAQGLARLQYLTAAGTLGLVTGASGVGKSALLKRVWYELRGPSVQVHYCTWRNSPGSPAKSGFGVRCRSGDLVLFSNHAAVLSVIGHSWP